MPLPLLEQGIAEFLAAELGVGLYNDPVVANRVLFLEDEPPVPLQATPPTDDGYETSNPLAITVFTDGAAPPTRRLLERTILSVQVRHPSYSTAMDTARQVFALLQENGGMSNGANPKARADFDGVQVARIAADFSPTPLGRDSAERGGRFRVGLSFTVRFKHYGLP